MSAPMLQPWVEYVGNAVCLDLVNTVNDWNEPAKDQLDGPSGFAAWAEAAGLGEDLASDLPQDALDDARDLRANLHRLLSAVIDREPPPVDAQQGILELYAEGWRNTRFVWSDGDLRLEWTGRDKDRILWRIADSAVGLLRSDGVDRLGRCPGCGWLYLDVTKNRSRRWCNMATCGSREKARRYYRRTTGSQE